MKANSEFIALLVTACYLDEKEVRHWKDSVQIDKTHIIQNLIGKSYDFLEYNMNINQSFSV